MNETDCGQTLRRDYRPPLRCELPSGHRGVHVTHDENDRARRWGDMLHGHVIVLWRDDDRLGQHYGQHYYEERMDGHVGKRAWLGSKIDKGTYDRYEAYVHASAVRRSYNADELVDMRPDPCLYGWSAD